MTITEPDLQSELTSAFDLAAGPPAVQRVAEGTDSGWISGLRWGDAPRVVFLHGRAPTQTAHAFDRLAVTWGHPLLALDLPGHGLSARRADGTYTPRSEAPSVADAIESLATTPVTLVGASFGGLVAIATAAARPGLVEQLVLIDATPGQPGAPIPRLDPRLDPADGFESREQILALFTEIDPSADPTRVAYNVHHATEQSAEGRIQWRRDAGAPPTAPTDADRGDLDQDWLDRDGLWDDLEALDVPITLIRGGSSPAVTDADIGELLTRRSDTRLVVVDGAGHEVQRDQPEQLARVLDTLVTETGR